jgi:toluene monooxygenase system protein B
VVLHNGRKLPAAMTVAEAGIAPLDHIAVEYDTPEGQS